MLTVKEKAIELIVDFKRILNIQNDMRPTVNPFAKACALKTVDEVLGHMGADRGYEFWSGVKDEIEKL
jgi:hypothetical protein